MQTWTTFVHKQEQLLGQEAAARWLHPLKVVHFDSGNLYLEAKDAFQLEWFEEQIRPLLKSQLLNPNGRSIKVHLTLANTETSPGSKGKGKTKVPPLVFFSDKLDPVMTLHNFVARASNAPLFRSIFCASSNLIDLNPRVVSFWSLGVSADFCAPCWGIFRRFTDGCLTSEHRLTRCFSQC